MRYKPRDISLTLSTDDASYVAQLLLQLAALIDPDDPDGLVDVHGVLHPTWSRHFALTEDQFGMLHPRMGYRDGDRARVAGRVRVLSSTIEGQLPGDAPEVTHRKRWPT